MDQKFNASALYHCATEVLLYLANFGLIQKNVYFYSIWDISVLDQFFDVNSLAASVS